MSFFSYLIYLLALVAQYHYAVRCSERWRKACALTDVEDEASFSEIILVVSPIALLVGIVLVAWFLSFHYKFELPVDSNYGSYRNMMLLGILGPASLTILGQYNALREYFKYRKSRENRELN